MDDLDDDQVVVVPVSEPGKETAVRLDQFLARHMSHLSRSRIQKLIDSDMILVDGEKAKASCKLKGGEAISLTLPPQTKLDLQAENIPINIVFEDQCLAVINKAAGMIVHPGAGVVSGTLVNALLYHLKESLSGIAGVERPGIVHRLDKDTSGLMVVAKDDVTHRMLSRQIADREVKRTYLTLLDGVINIDRGRIDKPIGRHPVKRKQMAITSTGRSAVSHFEVIDRWAKFSFVRVKLETGRTHQIRVHMASLGYPVVGDLVYNQKSTGNARAREELGLKGQALHAAQLTFTHPETGRLLEFEAPLPDDMQALIDRFLL